MFLDIFVGTGAKTPHPWFKWCVGSLSHLMQLKIFVGTEVKTPHPRFLMVWGLPYPMFSDIFVCNGAKTPHPDVLMLWGLPALPVHFEISVSEGGEEDPRTQGFSWCGVLPPLPYAF